MSNVTVCTILAIVLSVISLPAFIQGVYVANGNGRRDSEMDTVESESADQDSSLEWDSCNSGSLRCFERPPRQLEAGPFWANRGKRQPLYRRERLFADEPQWLLGRRGSTWGTYGPEDDVSYLNWFDPFFPTRGKKQKERRYRRGSVRDRRDPGAAEESPFFAARGKKGDNPLAPE